jgi:predicted AlkP superfamily phosphohydrolase/phosphomutase
MSWLFKKKKKKRACVIGLDGVPFTFLTNLAQNGVMPTFGDLMESGHLRSMKASLPEISSVSWTDFMTGKDSGRHGIFGFTDLKENSYDLKFPNFYDVKTPPFWNTLGEQKKNCIIINQPSTYPARKIPGMLVSGFVAIELAKAVYPSSLRQRLEDMNYQIDIDTFRSREDHAFMWKDLNRTLEGREKAFLSFWKEDWDYFELVITGTDRLQHFLWNAYEDDQHPDHQNFLDYYRKVDALVGKIVNAYRKYDPDGDGLFLLSDHGFTGIEQEVYLNAWLMEQGYLRFQTETPKDWNDVSDDSRAFAMDPNRIYIHTADRFPRGQVESSEIPELKQELTKQLKSLQYQGKPVIDNVFDTAEVYHGPHKSRGPDLIAVAKHGFDLKGSIKKKNIFDRSNLQGMHTWDNAFFWSRNEHSGDLRISGLSEIILSHFE